MKTEVLKLLKEYDGYLSGQEICQRLGVSRTAVWKVIKQLQSEGYQIEAVRNRGYHLTASTDVLTEAEIRSCVKGELMGCRVVCYEETDSTNTRARALAEEGAPEGTMTVAERQNAGKGRRGRSWSSPPGSGIFMSLVLRPDIPPSQASMVTLAAAVAVARGIRQATGTEMLVTNFILSRSSWDTLSYSGTTTRQPTMRARRAWGSEPETSARPPVAEKGRASLAQYKIFIISSSFLS